MSWEWAKRFSAFSVHPSLILQKHFLTHLLLVRHLMASILITMLFFLCRTNVFTSHAIFVCSHGDRRCKLGIKRFFVERVFTFTPFNIDEDTTRLPIIHRKEWWKFCWSIFAKPTCKKNPLVILGQSQGFPSRTFINETFMVLFCCSESPFIWGWYTEVMHC